MRTRWVQCGWVLVSFFGVAACGGVAEETKRDASMIAVPENVSESEFEPLLTEIGCQAFTPCCAQVGYEVDGISCKVNFAGNLGLAHPSGPYRYDSATATQCLKALQSKEVGCNRLPEPCRGVYQGTVPLGGACGHDSECESGEQPTSCDLLGSNVCVVTEHGELGDPCDQTCAADGERSRGCADTFVHGNADLPASTHVACNRAQGLYCDLKTAKCQPLVVVGSACRESLQCTVGAGCVEATDDTVSTMTCQPLAALGLSCQTAFDCAGDAYCDDQGTCRSPRTKDDGEPCSSSIECVGQICEQGLCTRAVFAMGLPEVTADAICGRPKNP
ncbi:MAG TPA: hypothetical protein VER96_06145 [Polyangiaceae bacterium]|nr:hypothetical protein [Polyangiaceae bacterium]